MWEVREAVPPPGQRLRSPAAAFTSPRLSAAVPASISISFHPGVLSSQPGYFTQHRCRQLSHAGLALGEWGKWRVVKAPLGFQEGREKDRERKRKKAKQTEAAARSTELQNWLLQGTAQVRGRGGGFGGE